MINLAKCPAVDWDDPRKVVCFITMELSEQNPEFVDSFGKSVLTFHSDGWTDWIEFLGIWIWDDCEDPRPYDEVTDERQPLLDFVLQRMFEIQNDIKKFDLTRSGQDSSQKVDG